MTYFQDDNGNVINIDDDIQIYKSAVNLFDFSIRGNFSTSFQVPNNSFFKNSFQYFTPLQIPANGFKATLFNMVRNGNIIERGQLVLEREDDDYLHFFFISGNSNWITKIPDISIRDIDYENYASEFVLTNIYALRNATDGFCYPLIDWGTLSKKTTNAFADFLDSSQNYYNALGTEWYPCFFIKSAIQEIFTYCQLKIGGDILDDKVYQQMIITPDDGQIKRASKFYADRKVSVSNESDSRFYPSATKINLDLTIENGVLGCWDSASQKYTANKSHLLNITFNFALSYAVVPELFIYKNGSFDSSYFGGGGSSSTALLAFNEVGQSFGTRDLFVDVTTGDYLEFYVGFGLSNKGTFNCGGSPTAPGGAIIGDYYTIGTPGQFGSLSSHVAVSTGDIVHANANGSGNASDWTVIPISTGINIAAGSILNLEPVKNLTRTAGSHGYDTIRASDILPDIKMIELIKFVSNYFCSIPTYDESTQTVYFNKLDEFNYSESKDWSSYLQKLENNYQIQTAKYNYIRFKEVDDSALKALGSNNALKYGDILIQGQSSQTLVKDLFQFPFGPSIDRFSYKYGFQTPFIPIAEMVPEGDPIKINSVTGGGGVAEFNTSSTTNFVDALVLIYGTGEYDGYCVGEMLSGTFIDPNVSYFRNAQGYIQPMSFNFKSEQSRILFFTGEQNISSFSNLSSILVGTVSHSSIGYAYFSKPTSAYSVASYKQGLNLDYYQGGYNDVPRGLDYYKNLTRILNAPYVKGWFYLPEAIYADFKFDSFIFIKDENQQRYYYVDSIENYKDSKTLVQVNMLLLP